MRPGAARAWLDRTSRAKVPPSDQSDQSDRSDPGGRKANGPLFRGPFERPQGRRERHSCFQWWRSVQSQGTRR